MHLEIMNRIFLITLSFVSFFKISMGDFVDSCHAFYNFEGNGPFNNVTNQGITWTSLPRQAEPCRHTGVLSLYPPSWAEGVEIAFTFVEDYEGWLFNLGDSPTNNGYGGDGNEALSTAYDAEIYSTYKSLNMWANEYGDATLPYYQNYTSFNNWLVMKFIPGAVAAYSDTGLHYTAYTYHLLQFGGNEATWYLGINRVVNPYNRRYVSGNRDGHGLCSVCIRWTTGPDLLSPPTEAPIRPAPGESPTDNSDAAAQSCLETKTCKVCYDFNAPDHSSFVNSYDIKEKGVEWAVFPDVTSVPCKAKSVLQLTPPEGALGAEITFTFTGNQQGWVFNLGDSGNNNGYGRGDDDNQYNAELHANFQQLQIYQSTLTGLQDLSYYSNLTAYKNWLVLKIKSGGMAAFSDLGLSFTAVSSYLLQFSSTNEWYLGINRVVQPVNSPSPAGARSGEGLCSVCIEWNTDGNLDDPQNESPDDNNNQSTESQDSDQGSQDSNQEPPELTSTTHGPNNQTDVASGKDEPNKGTKVALNIFTSYVLFILLLLLNVV